MSGVKNKKIVEAVVLDSQKRILLLKRSKKNSVYCGKWQLPGGKVCFGERVVSALKRELREELSCSCKKPRLLKHLVFSSFYKGRNSTAELFVYFCVLKGEIKLSRDHSRFRFFSKKSIRRSSLAPASRTALFNNII